MPNYIFAYHGGNMPETPEEGARHMEKWKAWVDRIGDAWVDPGNPVGMSKTVSSGGVADNGGSNPLMGFSIVKAESMEAAVEIAKGCPFVETGGMDGSIEVAEIMQMP